MVPEVYLNKAIFLLKKRTVKNFKSYLVFPKPNYID